MARLQFWDFESPDSTALFNNWHRGILKSGVYLGFNVGAGTTGLKISIGMDNDPDNTGLKLGKIITPDGVVVHEDEDLVDAATAIAGHSTLPRIDYLVATYVYNASEPPNEVSYDVLQGTAGDPPTPPTLNDNQVLLAEIQVPAGATLANQMTFSDVVRKSLYSDSNQLNIESILRQGVYSGGVLSKGSAANKVSLSALVALTPENKRVSSGTHADLFTLTNTGSAVMYRYDWVVMLHKFEDVEDNNPEFIVVEGSEADESAGAIASIPDDAAVLAAATAFNPKYDSANYITKLGYVRVQGSNTTMSAEKHHTPRLLLGRNWYVSAGKIEASEGANLSPGTSYWPYVGHAGLNSALDFLGTLINSYYAGEFDPFLNGQPVKLYVDGDFNFPSSSVLAVPSFVKIEGVGPTKFRFYPQASSRPSVVLGGITTTTFSASSAASQAGVPSGYTRWEFSVTGGADAANLTNKLDDMRFIGNSTGGDPVEAIVQSSGVVYTGYYESATTASPISNTNLTFTAIFPNAAVVGDATALALFKQHNGLKNVTIAQKTPSTTDFCFLSMQGNLHTEVDQVRAPGLSMSRRNSYLKIGFLEVNAQGCTTTGTSITDEGMGSVIKQIVVRPSSSTPAISLGLPGNSEVGSIVFDSTTGADMTNAFTLTAYKCSIGLIDFHYHAATPQITMNDSQVGMLRYSRLSGNPAINATINRCFIGVLRFESSGTETFTFSGSGADNLIGTATGNGLTLSGLGNKNYVAKDGAQNRDEDFNWRVAGDANFTWTLSTGNLSWDANIVIDLPYNTANNTVSASNATLSTDGDRLCFTTTRDGGTPTVSVVAKASAASLRNSEKFFFANRIGNVIYFFDGTRLEDGQTLKLGQSGVPDNSVTRAKMTDSAWAFFMKDHDNMCEVSPTYDFQDDIPFYNTGLVSYTYTATTGVIAFNSNVDLSSVRAGDTFIGGTGIPFRIESVSDVANTITIMKGLGTTDTSDGSPANKNSGMVARGALRFKNTGLVSYSYTASTGVVQFGGAVALTNMLAGWMFRDGAGNLYEINSVTAGSNQITIATNLTSITTTVGSSLSGAIYARTNPRGLSLNDLRPSYGIEEITFTGDYYDRRRGFNFTMNDTGSFGSTNPYVEWLDPRVAVTVPRASGTAAIPREASSAALSNPNLTLVASGTEDSKVGVNKTLSLEVTGYMTGLVFGVEDLIDDSTAWSGITVTVDGQSFTPANTQRIVPSSQTGIVDTSYLTHTPQAAMTSCEVLRKLSPGIHTISISASSPIAFPVRKIYIVNQPNEDYTKYWDTPGRFWQSAQAYDLQQDATVSFPSTSGTRGGRVVRYIPRTAPSTRAWAETVITTASTTGTTNSNQTISSVANTGIFSVGDLILLEHGSNMELHQITAIGVNQLTVRTNVGFSASGTTVSYVGRGWNSTISKQRQLLSGQEIAEAYTIADFLAVQKKAVVGGSPPFLNVPNLPNEGNGTAGQSGAYGWGGHSYTMGNTVITCVGTGSDYNRSGWTISGTTTSRYVRIGFVGTGLSLVNVGFTAASASANVTVYVDGCSIGNVLSPKAGDVLALCADLSYGFHTIEIHPGSSSPATDFTFEGFYIYRPATPSVDGTIIFATNRAANRTTLTDYPAAPSAQNNLQYAPIGYVHHGLWATAALQKSGSVKWAALNTLTYDQMNGYNSAFYGASGSQVMDAFIWFWGDAIRLVCRSDSGSSATVTVLDNDGTFRAPSALTGDTVATGSDTFSHSTGEGRQQYWVFDKCGLHCMKISGFRNDQGTEFLFYEVHQPFHSHERLNDALLGTPSLIMQTFEDKRKVASSKFGYKRYAGAWKHTFDASSGQSDSYVYAPVTSRGSYFRVRVYAYSDTAGIAPTISIMNEEAGKYGLVNTSGGSSSAVYEALVRIPRGNHPLGVHVRTSGAVTSDVVDVFISWEEVGNIEERSILNGGEVPRAFLPS